MINRIVLFRFKDDVVTPEIDKSIDMAKDFDSIRQLDSIEVVKNSMDSSNDNYHVALLMRFNSQNDIAVFSENPQHVEFVERISSQTKDIQVFDY